MGTYPLHSHGRGPKGETERERERKRTKEEEGREEGREEREIERERERRKKRVCRNTKPWHAHRLCIPLGDVTALRPSQY